MEYVADVGKIRSPFGEHVRNLKAQCAHQRNEGDPGNDPLHDFQRPAEKPFDLPVALGHLVDFFLNVRVVRMGRLEHGSTSRQCCAVIIHDFFQKWNPFLCQK